MIDRLQVKDFIQLAEGQIILDARSPSEYKHAHIPGAYSFPLFTDEERKVVGTTYKQQSREQAIKAGLDFFGPKMRGMVEEVEALIRTSALEGLDSAPTLYVYCWRGGMRSAAIAWLLDLYGYKLKVLAGGYKAFRNFILDRFEEEYPLRIIGGYTGSGKTEVLNTLKDKGEYIIDLEAIACHKGSAFGNINMPPQPSPEMFENQLGLELWNFGHKHATGGVHSSDAECIWLEDESQRIGNLNIPTPFWNSMRRAPVYFLDIPFEERLHHLVEEYGCLDFEKLKDATFRISKRLGGLETKTTLQYIDDNNIKEAFRILLHYYDKFYLKGLQNRENLPSLLKNIPCETVSADNSSLLLHQETISSH